MCSSDLFARAKSISNLNTITNTDIKEFKLDFELEGKLYAPISAPEARPENYEIEHRSGNCEQCHEMTTTQINAEENT